MFKIGNVYKIWWENDPDFYIGITKSPVAKAIANHNYNNKDDNMRLLYVKMRIKAANYKYVLLNSHMVNNADEKKKVLHEYINKLKPTIK